MTAPGALPIHPAATAHRARPANGPDARGSAGASPFASALDDALAADRFPGSDRAAERRSTPDDRAARALDRAADAAARADRAAGRAVERADRAADRAAVHADRAADRAAAKAERAAEAPARVDAKPADEVADTVTDPTATDTAEGAGDVPEESGEAAATETTRPGLPPALWAMTKPRRTA